MGKKISCEKILEPTTMIPTRRDVLLRESANWAHICTSNMQSNPNFHLKIRAGEHKWRGLSPCGIVCKLKASVMAAFSGLGFSYFIRLDNLFYTWLISFHKHVLFLHLGHHYLSVTLFRLCPSPASFVSYFWLKHLSSCVWTKSMLDSLGSTSSDGVGGIGVADKLVTDSSWKHEGNNSYLHSPCRSSHSLFVALRIWGYSQQALGRHNP